MQKHTTNIYKRKYEHKHLPCVENCLHYRMKNCGVDWALVCNYIIPVTGSQISPFSGKIYRCQHLTRIFDESIEYHCQEQWQYRNGFRLLSQDLLNKANAFSEHCCTCLIADVNTYETKVNFWMRPILGYAMFQIRKPCS